MKMMQENGHDENQENEANQNVLNVIVQEDNDEMNNAMIVEDSVDKLIPRNSNSFDLLNKDCQMTMRHAILHWQFKFLLCLHIL